MRIELLHYNKSQFFRNSSEDKMYLRGVMYFNKNK